MTEPETTAARVIDELLAGGQAIDEGSFSLDRAAAADKIESYRYTEYDRKHYLVPIMEGLFRLGAARVEIERLGADLEIRCAVELDDPVAALGRLRVVGGAFASEREARGIERLAVGVDMGLGIDSVVRIVVSHSTSSRIIVAEYRGQQKPTLVEHAGVGASGELRILIDRRWQERLARHGPGTLELYHLRQAVRRSAREVVLDGVPVSGQADPLDYVQIESGPGFRVQAGFYSKSYTGWMQSSRVEIWTCDLVIRDTLTDSCLFLARIEIDEPRYDLSQRELVEDETHAAAMAAVERCHERAREALARDDACWDDSKRPANWPRERVEVALGRAEPPRRESQDYDAEDLRRRLILIAGFTIGAVIVVLATLFLIN